MEALDKNKTNSLSIANNVILDDGTSFKQNLTMSDGSDVLLTFELDGQKRLEIVEEQSENSKSDNIFVKFDKAMFEGLEIDDIDGKVTLEVKANKDKPPISLSSTNNSLTLNVTSKDGTVKEYTLTVGPLGAKLFCEGKEYTYKAQDGNGKQMVLNPTISTKLVEKLFSSKDNFVDTKKLNTSKDGVKDAYLNQLLLLYAGVKNVKEEGFKKFEFGNSSLAVLNFDLGIDASGNKKFDSYYFTKQGKDVYLNVGNNNGKSEGSWIKVNKMLKMYSSDENNSHATGTYLMFEKGGKEMKSYYNISLPASEDNKLSDEVLKTLKAFDEEFLPNEAKAAGPVKSSLNDESNDKYLELGNDTYSFAATWLDDRKSNDVNTQEVAPINFNIANENIVQNEIAATEVANAPEDEDIIIDNPISEEEQIEENGAGNVKNLPLNINFAKTPLTVEAEDRTKVKHSTTPAEIAIVLGIAMMLIAPLLGIGIVAATIVSGVAAAAAVGGIIYSANIDKINNPLNKTINHYIDPLKKLEREIENQQERFWENFKQYNNELDIYNAHKTDMNGEIENNEFYNNFIKFAIENQMLFGVNNIEEFLSEENLDFRQAMLDDLRLISEKSTEQEKAEFIDKYFRLSSFDAEGKLISKDILISDEQKEELLGRLSFANKDKTLDTLSAFNKSQEQQKNRYAKIEEMVMTGSEEFLKKVLLGENSMPDPSDPEGKKMKKANTFSPEQSMKMFETFAPAIAKRYLFGAKFEKSSVENIVKIFDNEDMQAKAAEILLDAQKNCEVALEKAAELGRYQKLRDQDCLAKEAFAKSLASTFKLANDENAPVYPTSQAIVETAKQYAYASAVVETSSSIDDIIDKLYSQESEDRKALIASVEEFAKSMSQADKNKVLEAVKKRDEILNKTDFFASIATKYNPSPIENGTTEFSARIDEPFANLESAVDAYIKQVFVAKSGDFQKSANKNVDDLIVMYKNMVMAGDSKKDGQLETLIQLHVANKVVERKENDIMKSKELIGVDSSVAANALKRAVVKDECLADYYIACQQAIDQVQAETIDDQFTGRQIIASARANMKKEFVAQHEFASIVAPIVENMPVQIRKAIQNDLKNDEIQNFGDFRKHLLEHSKDVTMLDGTTLASDVEKLYNSKVSGASLDTLEKLVNHINIQARQTGVSEKVILEAGDIADKNVDGKKIFEQLEKGNLSIKELGDLIAKCTQNDTYAKIIQKVVKDPLLANSIALGDSNIQKIVNVEANRGRADTSRQLKGFEKAATKEAIKAHMNAARRGEENKAKRIAKKGENEKEGKLYTPAQSAKEVKVMLDEVMDNISRLDGGDIAGMAIAFEKYLQMPQMQAHLKNMGINPDKIKVSQNDFNLEATMKTFDKILNKRSVKKENRHDEKFQKIIAKKQQNKMKRGKINEKTKQGFSNTLNSVKDSLEQKKLRKKKQLEAEEVSVQEVEQVASHDQELS